ncbi:hypothetical protein B0I35DRAFT_515374 [Stachybotrys elegans]|uniref:Aminoglycoside phosphotransferase domain-containing protein n=1 Tax=Stachybotrys elegans TaxID=80388 RepID=A0A8K0SJ36_9HYPO|nr:hypothetical protein B0I35DRAFT_515374 [Stachybotrys elegans]
MPQPKYSYKHIKLTSPELPLWLRIQVWAGKVMYRKHCGSDKILKLPRHRLIKLSCSPSEVHALQSIREHITNASVPRILAVYDYGEGIHILMLEALYDKTRPSETLGRAVESRKGDSGNAMARVNLKCLREIPEEAMTGSEHQLHSQSSKSTELEVSQLAQQLKNSLGLDRHRTRRRDLGSDARMTYRHPTVEDVEDRPPKMVFNGDQPIPYLDFDFEMLPDPIDPVEPFSPVNSDRISWLETRNADDRQGSDANSIDNMSMDARAGSPSNSCIIVASENGDTGTGTGTPGPSGDASSLLVRDLEAKGDDVCRGKKRPVLDEFERDCDVEMEDLGTHKDKRQKADPDIFEMPHAMY